MSVMTSANDMMIVQMSKTVVVWCNLQMFISLHQICVCFFVEGSPQNCKIECFTTMKLLVRVPGPSCKSFSLFLQFKHKVRQICWEPCLWGLCATAAYKYCTSRVWASLVCSLCVCCVYVQLVWSVWKSKKTSSSVAWRMCGSANELY